MHVYHIDRIYYVLRSCLFQPIAILIANSHMPDEKNSLTLNFFKYLPLIFTEKILLQVRFYRFFFKFQPLCDFNFSRSSNIPPNFKPFFSKYEWKTLHFFILILQKLSCQKWTFILVMMLIKYLRHCSSSFVTSCSLKRLSRPTFKKKSAAFNFCNNLLQK